MLASVLKGVISQRLVPTADGEGRTAIVEVLRSTGRVLAVATIRPRAIQPA